MDAFPGGPVSKSVDESDGTRGPRRSGKTLRKLCVFSADGKSLVTKQLELENNVNVAIIRDPVDLRNTIVALGGGRVWRFKLDGSPSSLKQQEVKPNQSARQFLCWRPWRQAAARTHLAAGARARSAAGRPTQRRRPKASEAAGADDGTPAPG